MNHNVGRVNRVDTVDVYICIFMKWLHVFAA